MSQQMKKEIENTNYTMNLKSQLTFLENFIEEWEQSEEYELKLLTLIYTRFLNHNGLTSMSADELLCELREKHFNS